jgi:hypothetical protein
MSVDDKIVDIRESKTSEDDFMAESRYNYDFVNSYEQQNLLDAQDDLMNLNGVQWPLTITAQRELDGRPVITINKLPGFCDGVKGDARINQMQIKVRAKQPTLEDQKNNKPQELANIYNGLIRQIEQTSNANYARLSAFDCAVQNGFGFYEVEAYYSDDDTFDQDLRTVRIKDQFSVMVDPMHKEADSRDKKWCFKSQRIRRKEFKALYPDIEPSNFRAEWAQTPYMHWVEEDFVRVAEYWVLRPFKKKLVAVRKEDGSEETYNADKWAQVEDDLRAKEQIMHVAIDEAGQPIPTPGPAPEGSGFEETIVNPVPKVVRSRTVDSHVVVKYIIDGTQIIDGPRNDAGKIILDFKTEDDIKETDEDGDKKFRKFIWPGKWIPIIPVWGKELQIGNQTVRRSLFRFAKDSQRNYNYHVTAETERTALARIPPAILTKTQLGNWGPMWKSSKNLKYLLYEPDASPGAVPPYFPNPPQASTGNIYLINQATQDMKDTMSIQDASLGKTSGKEISGIAKQVEQRKNDVSNFEFLNNLKTAVNFEGDIYVNVIPYYYDKQQQLMILNEKGEEEFVTINETVKDDETGEEVILNDLTQGKYLVTVTAGPNFTTQRIETAEALTALSGGVRDPAGNLALTAKVVENMDWPGAEETAELLERLLPPGIVEQKDEDGNVIDQQQSGPDQEQQQAQARAQALEMAAKLQGQLLKNQETELDIEKKQGDLKANAETMQDQINQLDQLIQQMHGGGQ